MALLELVNLGYTYLPRSEVTRLRESTSQYILRDIAFKALRKIRYKEKVLPMARGCMDKGRALNMTESQNIMRGKPWNYSGPY